MADWFGSPDPTIVNKVTEATIPGWYEDPLRRLIQASEWMAEEPYQTYGGQRLAGFSPDQMIAQQMIRSEGGNFQPELDRAKEYNLQAGTAFGNDQGAISDYMSPYMQEVIDLAKDEASRDYNKQLATDNRILGTSGAFGGTRHAIREAEGERNLMRNLSDIQTKGQQTAYDRALAAMEKDRQAQFDASKGSAALSLSQQNQDLAQANALMGIGSQTRAMDQASMDMAYQDFINQRDYPKTQAGWYSNMLRGVPQNVIGNNQQTSTQPGGTNTLSQLTGAATALLSNKDVLSGAGDLLSDAWDWAGSLFDWAEGGLIPSFAEGGEVSKPGSIVEDFGELRNMLAPVANGKKKKKSKKKASGLQSTLKKKK